MSKNHKNILIALGLAFMLVGRFVPVRYFGQSTLSQIIMRNIIFFSGLLSFYIATREKFREKNNRSMGPYGIISLCAPTILGVLATLVAQSFRPGNRMPLETISDRFFVDLVVVGFPLSLIGLPLILFALYEGVYYVRREGFRSVVSKLIILILVIAIGASSYTVKKAIGSIAAYKPTSKHHNEVN